MAKTDLRKGDLVPEDIRQRMEKACGADLSDVRVHYNSIYAGPRSAIDYTRGPDIHLAPGQAGLLGHELAHVVQQRHGRVSETGRSHVGLNDDPDTSAIERDLLAKRIQM